MPKYIGLTIGPIYKTLSLAKKTRELWGSSYIFSYLMKKILSSIKNDLKREIIIPYIDDQILTSNNEAGLIHDRLIFKSEEGDYDKLKDIIANILEEIGSEVHDKDFIFKYFKLYFCEIEENDDYKQINKKLNKYLDNLELQEVFISESKGNPLLNYFTNRLANSFLVKDAFGDKRLNFPTLIEIALSDLMDKQENKDELNKCLNSGSDEDETKLYENFEKRDILYKYHKYIAVVQADGDDLSKAIEGLADNDSFKVLSKALLDFAKNANQLIKDYGGVTVFAGGDDLLFFAPVVNKLVKKNIFVLIKELSELFNESFNTLNIKPTLSIGLSISYYKFPLNEARDAALEQLKKAKKMLNKNSISFSLLKHSGQQFEAVINKNSTIFSKFMDFVKLEDDSIDSKNPGKILSSVAHKIASFEFLLNNLMEDDDLGQKIDNIFENYFNESVHFKLDEKGDKVHKDYLDNVKEMTKLIYFDDSYKTKSEIDEPLKSINLYSLLRANKFIREKI